jgi:hypothetical protein
MSEPHQPQHAPGSHYQPGLSVVLVILVLFVGATYFILRSPGHATSSATSTTQATTTTRGTKQKQHVVAKSKVRVQVANGTNITGLAGTYTHQLLTLGWDALPELNGPAVISTIIYYNPGYEWAAKDIASEIKVSSSAVKSLNGANPVAGSAGDNVVVILGHDVATTG